MRECLRKLAANPPPDVIMVHATGRHPDTNKPISHTFTVDGEWYFDNNVKKGKPVPLLKAPEDVLKLSMRIVNVLIVECPEPSKTWIVSYR